jgi:hypothetical protein
MKRHRAILLLVAALTTVIGLMVPAPAMAAVHCDGSGCNGKKITETDCMTRAYAIGGLEVKFSSKTVARADLWFSPSCHAMWGDYNASDGEMFASVELQTQPEYGGVNAVPFSEYLRGPGNVTTTMVDWQQSVRVCANGGTLTCTPWR